MLKEIDRLGVFFEDCYKEYSVREYARKVGISPPSASKVLKEFARQGFLLLREDRGFLFFIVNRENKFMKDLSRIYWRDKLSELLDYLEKEINPKSIVLFGSLSKLEAKEDSDVDIVIFSIMNKKLDVKKFERKLKREIQIINYNNLAKVNEELRLNIINGYMLRGYLS